MFPTKPLGAYTRWHLRVKCQESPPGADDVKLTTIQGCQKPLEKFLDLQQEFLLLLDFMENSEQMELKNPSKWNVKALNLICLQIITKAASNHYPKEFLGQTAITLFILIQEAFPFQKLRKRNKLIYFQWSVEVDLISNDKVLLCGHISARIFGILLIPTKSGCWCKPQQGLRSTEFGSHSIFLLNLVGNVIKQLHWIGAMPKIFEQNNRKKENLSLNLRTNGGRPCMTNFIILGAAVYEIHNCDLIPQRVWGPSMIRFMWTNSTSGISNRQALRNLSGVPTTMGSNKSLSVSLNNLGNYLGLNKWLTIWLTAKSVFLSLYRFWGNSPQHRVSLVMGMYK
ncbi:hypothetical protein VP01_4911g1 [Puccinia sorghi]|uniref:Uncharacterized protein n=1 Tax=Puccinia sorghi TaxID=27349 RepID=A0A0L6UM42_9BASI|nr:hypothetical protein VP01_4911g1 [Puccinia sorghi]